MGLRVGLLEPVRERGAPSVPGSAEPVGEPGVVPRDDELDRPGRRAVPPRLDRAGGRVVDPSAALEALLERGRVLAEVVEQAAEAAPLAGPELVGPRRRQVRHGLEVLAQGLPAAAREGPASSARRRARQTSSTSGPCRAARRSVGALHRFHWTHQGLAWTWCQ
jgi:hypothetical protein